MAGRIRNRFFVWDVESTSKFPTEDHIISIGGVLCDFDARRKSSRLVPLHSFHTYVYTNRKIDAGAQKIHHISQKDLAGAPTFPEAIAELTKFLQKWIVHGPNGARRVQTFFMAHNGRKFDDVILYCNFVQHNMDFEGFLDDVACRGFVDSLPVIKGLFDKLEYRFKPKDPKTGRVSYALGNCYSFFCKKTLENAHDALADSQALVDVCTSDEVAKRLNRQTLLKAIVDRRKAVNWVRQTSGVAFQRQELRARNARLRDASIEVESEEQVAPVPSMTVSGPIMELTSYYRVVPAKRLCKRCVQIVRPDHKCPLGRPDSSPLGLADRTRAR